MISKKILSTLANKEDLLTAANKLDISYIVGSNLVVKFNAPVKFVVPVT